MREQLRTAPAERAATPRLKPQRSTMGWSPACSRRTATYCISAGTGRCSQSPVRPRAAARNLCRGHYASGGRGRSLSKCCRLPCGGPPYYRLLHARAGRASVIRHLGGIEHITIRNNLIRPPGHGSSVNLRYIKLIRHRVRCRLLILADFRNCPHGPIAVGDKISKQSLHLAG
jgi:hypothetical protein